MKRFVQIVACLACAPALLFSCKEGPADNGLNTLEVSPSENISFAATGNEAVTLTVTTDADSWDFTAPEWVEATKTDNALMVNAQDNTTESSRVGRIEFTAGNAEPVKISVVQAAGSGSSTDGNASVVDAATGTSDGSVTVNFKTLSEIPSGEAQVKVVLAEPASQTVTVTLSLDPQYLEEYILLHDDMNCELFPESAVSFSSKTVTVAAGETESDPVTLTLNASAEGLMSNVKYLVPVMVSDASGAAFSTSGSRVNFIFQRHLEKEVKNVVYFEVNDCNPLNAIEYLLEDGTPFFDAVILFAGNINYNSTVDLVYLSNNPNVTALLEGTDTFLQPIREKGIKVYLGLLGNHDAAGLCQLSDWGSEMFAKQVADAMLEYKIDGVNLDDEYSNAPIIGNKWFATRSSAAGSRLCYELKKAMAKTCPWDTEVSVFRYGSLSSLRSVDGVDCSEFVDFWVADYGGSTSPAGNMTYKQCSYTSCQCNYGTFYGATESEARSAKERGYGWCMWFAFDPSGTGTVPNNYSSSFNAMSKVAKGLYDMELMRPTGVWDKISEGHYSDVRRAM